MRLRDVKEYFNKLPDDILDSEFGLIINDVKTDVEGLLLNINLIPDNFVNNTLDVNVNRGIQDITWSFITSKYAHGTLKVHEGRIEGHIKCNACHDDNLVSITDFESDK